MRTLLVALLLVLLAGCSNKQYYKPEKTVNDDPVCERPGRSGQEVFGQTKAALNAEEAWPPCRYLRDPLADSTAEGAVTEAGALITVRGKQPVMFPKESRFLGQSEPWLLFGAIDGNVTLVHTTDANRTRSLALKKSVASASVQGETLAVLFANNDMALYSLRTGKPLYRAQGTEAVAVDHRIAQPHFLGPLVIFPTLDGKYVVVDSQSQEVLSSTIVSTETYFDNIFYFNVIGDTMVAATQNQLFALSDKERRAPYHLRDVVFDAGGIWIATKEGEVIHLNPALQVLSKKKFPFAHFLGMIVGDKQLYLLENEGYLIVLDKGMTDPKVYRVELDEGAVFATDRAFFAGDRVITVH